MNGIDGYPAVFPLILCLIAAPAAAQVVGYTDEGQFLADAAALGLCVDVEGFEDDAVWGGARTPSTAPSVAKLGLTWTPNNPNSGLTTGGGPARTGLWGFYELPHGDFGNGTGDGWFVESGAPMFAAGGWLVSNTPGAKLNIVVDGTGVVDFSGDNQVWSSHRFFGVIDPGGFTSVEFREIEGTEEDQKFMFADDFSFGRNSCFAILFEDGFESGDLGAWSSVGP